MASYFSTIEIKIHIGLIVVFAFFFTMFITLTEEVIVENQFLLFSLTCILLAISFTLTDFFIVKTNKLPNGLLKMLFVLIMSQMIAYSIYAIKTGAFIEHPDSIAFKLMVGYSIYTSFLTTTIYIGIMFLFKFFSLKK
jgi:hypothetical protein